MKFKTKEDWKCIKIDRYKFKHIYRDLLTKRLNQVGIPVHEYLLDKRYWYIEKDLDLLFGTVTSTFQKEEYFELLPYHLINIKNKLK